MKRALLFLALAVHALAQSTISTADKFAWGANAGWVSFRPSAADGAVVGEYVCRGFAWGANVGWLNLGDGTPANGIRYANTDAADFGVNTLPGGALRGLAWAANVGWVNFETNGNPRVDLATGRLSGYAWAANAGWIHLGNQNFFVKTDTIQSAPDSDGDGIADAWELENAGNLLTLGVAGDYDGDGVADAAEYLADTDPLDAADRFRITGMTLDFDPVVEVALTFTSRVSRCYVLEFMDYTGGALSGVWQDRGLGLFCGDSDTTTTRTFAGPPATRRIFRARALPPLAP